MTTRRLDGATLAAWSGHARRCRRRMSVEDPWLAGDLDPVQIVAVEDARSGRLRTVGAGGCPPGLGSP